METGLDPINSPVKDEAAMNVLRLESRVTSVVDYLARLKVAMSRIDTSLWPGTTLQNDLESLMVRLNEVPGQWRNGRNLLLDVVLMSLCLWSASIARRREKKSWPPSKLPILGSTTFRTSWRLLLLLPLVLQT